MDQKTLLTIVLLVLISSQLWTIIWDLGKAALYIVGLLLALTYLNPDTANKVKEIFRRIINLDSSLISNSMASVSEFMLSVFQRLPNMINSETIQVIKQEIQTKLENKNDAKDESKNDSKDDTKCDKK